MKAYDHKKLERKWQSIWEKKKIYEAQNSSQKPKYYSLIEFPYPSGDGLHVGHPRPYIGVDVISRKKRMQGFNVLYPIGWDAFGLPTENYAIKTGKDPRVVTRQNTDTFRRQIKSLGISFDWSREINTTDPKYYKWTQWIFLQFLKKGLAYKARMTINWCPSCKIGLANEEVVNGSCERCGTPAEKREKEQWMLAITKYADRLYKDLDDVDYLPQIKLGQRNWIGRSEGAEVDFPIFASSNFSSLRPSQSTGRDPREQKIQSGFDSVKVFTTRPDTIFGATYLVLAPEHELIKKLKKEIKNWSEVERYIAQAKNKVDIERTIENKEKTGIELKGIKAINPATKEEIPVWVADYVLVSYGTGAIMAVPAHDERDWEFAKKYNLPIKYVIAEPEPEQLYPPKKGQPFVYRKAVECYIRNPKDDTFLFLEWKTAKWKSPITGGVEEGEDIVEAARREIYEETGYKNLKLIQHLGTPIRADFFHPGKNENRRADFYGLFFELENETKDEVGLNEMSKHIPMWIPRDKVTSFINTSPVPFRRIRETNLSYSGEGVLINSGKFNDLTSEQAKKEITKFIGGKEKVTFKLRDWIFSRQRYWGEPIPVINCEKPARPDGRSGGCGLVPVPEKDLPVELPKVKNYQPTDSGESPLANIAKWVNVKCPKCKGKAKRETDTMPNWAGSSWYYLRYTDPKNNKEFASQKNLKYFTPVDWYNGGNEHTTLHLLYSRFWHKFLFDLKLVPTAEPYMKRTSHGLILAEGGEKMSKSKGNVINPDDIVKIYGADTLRLYEMFMGPFDQAIAWSEEAIIGPRRFLEKVWNLQYKVQKSKRELYSFHLEKTIQKVSDDIEAMKFNTAISTLMIFVNNIEKHNSVRIETYEKLLKLLSPFAPHITEEIWQALVHKKSIHLELWPEPDMSLADQEEVTIVVQINGKVRGQFKAARNINEIEATNMAENLPEVKKWIEGKEIKKLIYVKNRLINIVL